MAHQFRPADGESEMLSPRKDAAAGDRLMPGGCACQTPATPCRHSGPPRGKAPSSSRPPTPPMPLTRLAPRPPRPAVHPAEKGCCMIVASSGLPGDRGEVLQPERRAWLATGAPPVPSAANLPPELQVNGVVWGYGADWGVYDAPKSPRSPNPPRYPRGPVRSGVSGPRSDVESLPNQEPVRAGIDWPDCWSPPYWPCPWS